MSAPPRFAVGQIFVLHLPQKRRGFITLAHTHSSVPAAPTHCLFCISTAFKMPRRKFIDKKTATTFQLVHRAQNDPLIHDENAPSMVFAEKSSKLSRRPTEDDYAYSDEQYLASGTTEYKSTKTRQRGDLEEEFGLSFKPHEGEAAQHGIFFDDTEYDYMQHMRDLGSGEGSITWVEASVPGDSKTKKGKQKLEDAIRSLDLDESRSVGGESMASSNARSLLPDEVLPSQYAKKQTYQDQQDVPDEIRGFQPDMDPRLREVLEALDNEEYVDDDDDIFAELTKDGYEIEKEDWNRLGEQQLFDNDLEEEDDGWESDDTIRAANLPSQAPAVQIPNNDMSEPPEDVHAQPPEDPTEGAWLDEFKKFKSDSKASKETTIQALQPTPSTFDASIMSSFSKGHKKRRKGAKTSTTNYSMSSSALARTDQQTLLDDRFDKFLEKEDMLDEMAEEDAVQNLPDSASMISGMTGMSKVSRLSKYSNVSGLSGISHISSYSRATDSEAPQLVRQDFDGIMDDFLGSYSTTGKSARRIKRGGPQSGMEQLDEIRKSLGPARLKGRTSARV